MIFNLAVLIMKRFILWKTPRHVPSIIALNNIRSFVEMVTANDFQETLTYLGRVAIAKKLWKMFVESLKEYPFSYKNQ